MHRVVSPALRCTYRVQLTRAFPFARARALVPQLDTLGVSHLYSSPVLAARAGSTHGYDVVDPTRVSPELGGEADLRALAAALHERGMGLLVDIVPNHMSTGAENRFWDDVLRRGRESPYASWFDIDWDAPAAAPGRVTLPVLGDRLEQVVARGELRAVHESGEPRVRYFEHSFPLRTDVAPPASDAGAETWMRLLDQQHYRLTHWRRAAREINYRRFFDVNDLVALRMEDAAVFRATHGTLLRLVADGVVDAFRIDHVDGLRDPLAYLRQLRTEIERRRPGAPGTVPILVEKILSPGERLRPEWPVQGTTGYEFISEVEGIFVCGDGLRTIDRAYRAMRRIPARAAAFTNASLRGKREVLRGPLGPDVARLVRHARAALAERVPAPAPAPGEWRAAREAIVEFIAALPVYRTYLDARTAQPHPDDVASIRTALQRVLAAMAAHPEQGADLAALRDHLLLPEPPSAPTGDRLAFVERLQQTSGPATAKGVEDTALYRYVPLVSLDEVGGDPDRDPDQAVPDLHRANAHRSARWPQSLLAGSTHDTKRSADVRARLDALSEVPADWIRAVARWRRLNRQHRLRLRGRLAPDENHEYLLYQTVVGVWPAHADADAAASSIRERVADYMVKAAREGKERTTWTDPQPQYEAALRGFVHAVLATSAGAEFREDLAAFVGPVARAGRWNALARLLLHLTSPGVPDIYQGDELWNHSLVDPDNRRTVAHEQTAAWVSALAGARDDQGTLAEWCREMREAPDDPRIKLWVTLRALAARRREHELFERGGYLPLAARGAAAAHVVAFARRLDDDASASSRMVVVVVPRLTMSLVPGDRPPVGETVWRDTELILPDGAPRVWRCALAGHEVTADAHGGVFTLRLARGLLRLPVALLVAGAG